MNPKKDITIYDIAHKLNISSATVSRALNDSSAINKNTRKRVQDTAKALGYRHNTFASSLRKQKTNLIGVMVHELNSNFITSVLTGIENITNEAGYDLLIAHSNESAEKEKANALNLFNKRVDGLIASLSFETQGLDHFNSYKERNIPIVFFDRVAEDGAFTKVIIDNAHNGYQATAHLLDQGCKRIAILTGNLNRNVYAKRYSGYLAAHQDRNVKPFEELVLIKNLSEAAGIAAAHELAAMNPRPDGIFITNDFVAAVCMHELQLLGIKIPEDMAIVGFNNDAVSHLVYPRLTTIHYPGIEMGEIAARSLINHLEGVSNISKMKTIIVETEFIIRESSLKKQPGHSAIA